MRSRFLAALALGAVLAACTDDPTGSVPSDPIAAPDGPSRAVSAASIRFRYPCFTSTAPDQATANAQLRDGYLQWKSRFVTASGAGGHLRVTRGAEGNHDTVSEGIGWGMLLAAYMGDKATFDGLWNYAKLHFVKDASGNVVHQLMRWNVDANGVGINDNNSATDADQDMALALIAADRKWGGYATAAQAVLRDVMLYDVEATTNVLKPGDHQYWGGSSITNPSYFAPGYYRVFRDVSGEARWDQVRTKVWQIIGNVGTVSGTPHGLVPDWTNAAGQDLSGQDPTKKYAYLYDATRAPWRIAKEAAWYCDAGARAHLDKMNAFFKGIGPTLITDGYTLAGVKINNAHNSVFTAPAAAGAIASSDVTYRQAMWTETVKLVSGGGYGYIDRPYYNDILRMLSMLFASGNMPNPVDTTTARLSLDDFESRSTSRWTQFNDAATALTRTAVDPGAVGWGMKVDYAISATGYGGVLHALPGRSWSRYQAFDFWFRGTGSGNTIRLEIQDNRGDRTTDTAERWEFTFVDDFTGWRYFDVPWSWFTRRSWQPAGAPNDGLTLTEVWGYSFAPLSGTGSFQLDRIELIPR